MSNGAPLEGKSWTLELNYLLERSSGCDNILRPKKLMYVLNFGILHALEICINSLLKDVHV